MSDMPDRHCCWGDHACSKRAVAVVAWARADGERGHMRVCEEHLVVVRMKAAIRGVPVYLNEGPDKARGGQ